MSARDILKQRREAATKSEEHNVGGAHLRCRGMLLGERNRVMTEAYRADGGANFTVLYPLVLGMCVTDAESGQIMWNPNTQEGRQAMDDELSNEDGDFLFKTCMRLSGMDAESVPGKGSAETRSSDSSSPSATAFLPAA